MTLPSTEELQRLLSLSEKGPWAAISDHPYISIVFANDPDQIHAPIVDIRDGTTDEPDVLPKHELLALAPVLASEVIRLREENERMQERVNKHAQDALRLTKYLHDHHPAVSAEFKSNLARILEGDEA